MIEFVHWADAVCEAPSLASADVMAALGIDSALVTRVGSQLCCPAPEGVEQLELVLERGGTDRVAFVTAVLTGDVPVAGLEARFGAGRTAVAAPHGSAPTVVFGRRRPVGAARSCTVLARLTAPGADRVAVVSLYLHADPGRP
ncbi:hypothetical protein ABT369_25690 [Dactylosporangium sp. NPDC000244]|uniref:hypothetical protein n=1 Tax=Dactylosporangium sp. NPDC000244 TaxID=3154365 RepID=UPI0033214CC2